MNGLNLFQAVITLIGVLALAWYCSRLLGKQWGKSSASGSMRVIEQIQVGQNQKILLLQINDHNYLVGVSQAGIQLLAELEGDFQAAQPPGLPDPPFQELLKKYLTPHQKKGEKRDD